MTVRIEKLTRQVLMSNFNREEICWAYEWVLRVGSNAFPMCTDRNTIITVMLATQAAMAQQEVFKGYPSYRYSPTVYLIGNNTIVALSTNMQVSSINLVSGETDCCMFQLVKKRTI